MKHKKSKQIQAKTNQNHELKQKIDNFLKQTKRAKVIYPRKNKILTQQSQMFRQQSQQIKEEISFQDQYIKMNKMPQPEFIPFNKKVSRYSGYEKDQVQSRSSKMSNYQPKILQSFAIQKPNPQNKSAYSRQSRRQSRVFSQKNILQQSNYIIQPDVRSQYSGSSMKHKSRMLTEVVNQVGIQNDNFVNQFNQYTDLKGIKQFIRKQKQSSVSSMYGRAYTESGEKYKNIKQIGEETFRSHTLEMKKFLSRSQVGSKSKPKLDLYVPFNNKFLPQIQGSTSMSKLLNRKMRTESSSPVGSTLLKDEIKKKMLRKVDEKIKNSKSPSQKRLRQDYKYLIQNDDSQRYHQRIKPLMNQDKKKIKFLKVKEEMLGKIVLQRVQKHLKQQTKLKPNYITRVKSQKSIDQALIEFLKMKVNRADKALS